MKAGSWVVLMSLLLSVIATGCSTMPATPDQAARVAQRFLQARAAHNAGAVRGMLTVKAQDAITGSDVAQYMDGEQFHFGSVGTPIPKDDGWVQVPVSNYHVQNSAADTNWPEVLLTLHYESKQWLVAWVEPVASAARRAYENGQYGAELDLADAISQIDPYHYRGPLEYHFAYRGLKRYREAEVYLNEAAQLATPVQQPDVEDATARFKLGLGHPEDAAPHAQAALDKAAPYVPAVYPYRWQADTLVVLGQALQARGDRAGAQNAAQQAAKLDPENAGLAMLLRSLTP